MKNGHALHLYFGDGKGKTTAAMGLAVRAAGQGRKVLIGQFLKTNTTGEFDSLRKLENVVLALGEPVAGLTMGMSDAEREEEKARQKRNFERICARVEEEKPDVIVLDEFLVADHLGYLDGERAARGQQRRRGDRQCADVRHRGRARERNVSSASHSCLQRPARLPGGLFLRGRCGERGRQS